MNIASASWNLNIKYQCSCYSSIQHCYLRCTHVPSKNRGTDDSINAPTKIMVPAKFEEVPFPPFCRFSILICWYSQSGRLGTSRTLDYSFNFWKRWSIAWNCWWIHVNPETSSRSCWNPKIALVELLRVCATIWRNSFPRLADFQAFAAAGINTLRIPVGIADYLHLITRILVVLFGSRRPLHPRLRRISRSSDFLGSTNWFEGLDRSPRCTWYWMSMSQFMNRLPKWVRQLRTEGTDWLGERLERELHSAGNANHCQQVLHSTLCRNSCGDWGIEWTQWVRDRPVLN